MTPLMSILHSFGNCTSLLHWLAVGWGTCRYACYPAVWTACFPVGGLERKGGQMRICPIGRPAAILQGDNHVLSHLGPLASVEELSEMISWSNGCSRGRRSKSRLEQPLLEELRGKAPPFMEFWKITNQTSFSPLIQNSLLFDITINSSNNVSAMQHHIINDIILPAIPAI